jgi:chaperonin GroEL (HSP60 family)
MRMCWEHAVHSNRSKSVLSVTTSLRSVHTYFHQSIQSKTATIVIRGGANQFIKEAERSLNDAIMIVRRCFKASNIVPGGGAV